MYKVVNPVLFILFTDLAVKDLRFRTAIIRNTIEFCVTYQCTVVNLLETCLTNCAGLFYARQQKQSFFGFSRSIEVTRYSYPRNFSFPQTFSTRYIVHDRLVIYLWLIYLSKYL